MVNAENETTIEPTGDDGLFMTMLLPCPPALITFPPDAGVARTAMAAPGCTGLIVRGVLTVFPPPGNVKIPDWDSGCVGLLIFLNLQPEATKAPPVIEHPSKYAELPPNKLSITLMLPVLLLKRLQLLSNTSGTELMIISPL